MRALFIAALLLLAGAASAQEGDVSRAELPAPVRLSPLPLRFDLLTLEDGLSQVSVYSIFQDAQGYMWFGTQDGLNRYDGRGMTTYRSIPFDSTTLSSNIVSALAQGDDGLLWVGTEAAGLNRLDPETGQVDRFRHVKEDSTSLSNDFVTALLVDSSGELWVGTRIGLNHFEPATGSFQRVAGRDAGGLSSGYILGLMEGAHREIWVSTNNGINRIRPDGKIDRFLEASDSKTWTEANIFHGLYTESGNSDTLWAGTQTGIARLDTRTGTLRRFNVGGVAENGVINHIAPDPISDRYFWLAAPRLGLVRFDRYDGSTITYGATSGDVTSFPSNGVISVRTDRSGMVWAGTGLTGVVKFDPGGQSFAHFRYEPGRPFGLSAPAVFSIAEDETGYLWVASVGDQDSFLDRINRRTGEVKPRSLIPKGRQRASGLATVYRRRDGSMWIARPSEILRVDPKSLQVRQYALTAKSGPGANVLKMFEDRAGTLWLGTAAGLGRFDETAGNIVPISSDGPDGADLAHATVRDLKQDLAGTLWVATLQSGLFRLAPSGTILKRFVHDADNIHSLGSDHLMSIHERSAEPGVLWVGTFAGGLNRLEVASGTVRVYTTRDGLPNDVLYCILEDDEGELWMSSNRGLTRFSPDTGIFRNFTPRDGLQSFEFNQGACYKGENGELFFGGVNGLNAFFPGQARVNPNPPQVVITSFRLQNVPVKVGAGTPLPEPLSRLDLIRLGPRQNTIGFDFAALHFDDPSANRFAYRLDGLDEAWTDAGTSTTATYTNLDPGDYVFRVRAANSDGIWNNAGASIAVSIRPPWWRTPWAFALYGLFIGGLTAALHRMQRSRVIRKERERALIREKELRAEAAEAQAKYLQAENRRKTQELESARQIQLSMLPASVPSHPHLEIAARMETAAEVGGDYYDFHTGANGALMIAIGDATGHGVEAGSVVTATKGMLSLLASGPDLSEILRSSSAALRRMNLHGLFMALALARYQDRRLELVGAGMPPALVYRAVSATVDLVSLKGLPLGSPSDYTYRPQEITLAAGDVVLLMSDGIPELFGHDGEMFGTDRLSDMLVRLGPHSAERIVGDLFAESREWASGKRHRDDMTLLAVKVTA